MSDTQRKLAVVTGASTGIGLELARECAKNNFDLIIAANEAEIEGAAVSRRPRRQTRLAVAPRAARILLGSRPGKRIS